MCELYILEKYIIKLFKKVKRQLINMLILFNNKIRKNIENFDNMNSQVYL